MNYSKYIKNDMQWVKYYDFTSEKWEEGIVCEQISDNKWMVLFPGTFSRGSYCLAMEVKDGEIQKDYCAYKFDLKFNS